MNGGRGNDELVGGGGGGGCVFNELWNAGRDTITARQAGDLIRLEGVGLTGSVTQGLGANLLAGEVSLSVQGGVRAFRYRPTCGRAAPCPPERAGCDAAQPAFSRSAEVTASTPMSRRASDRVPAALIASGAMAPW